MRPARYHLIVLWLLGLVGLLALVAAGTSLWLASWIPTKGKAWLEAKLEEHVPLDITIGRLQYTPWHGLSIDELQGTDRKTGVRWLHATSVNVRIGLLSLALQRQVLFRLAATLDAPCETQLVSIGRYGLRDRHVRVDVLAPTIPIDRIIPALAAHLPPALKSGEVSLDLRATWEPGHPLLVSGKTSGTDVRWQSGQFRLLSNVLVLGTLTIAPSTDHPCSTDLVIVLDHGAMEGLPLVGTAMQVTGKGHLVNDQLTLEQLRGISGQAPWTLEGLVSLDPQTHGELVLRTRLDAATLATAFPDLATSWKPSGEADLLNVGRGWLALWPTVELMLDASLLNGAVPPRKFPHRIDHIGGHLRYDHLTKRLTIERLTGELEQQPVSILGSVRWVTPVELDLVTDVRTDLKLFSELVPQPLLQQSRGPVSIHAHVGGTTSQPIWQGDVTLADATALVKGLPHPLEHVNGTVFVSRERVTSDGLTFALNGESVAVAGAITELLATPRLEGHASAGEASVTVHASFPPDRITVDDWELAIGASKLRIHGFVARRPHESGQLSVRGTMTMRDLFALPWLDLSSLRRWQPEGTVELQCRLLGTWKEWRATSAFGFVRSESLTVRGLPLKNISAEIEQGQGRLAVHVTNATLAGGRLSSECILEQTDTGRYLLDVDLTMADLAQLSNITPAWRERPAEGNVSGHVSLMGLRNDPASLRGQGWLHAKGEHLTDVPLLNHLLRGLFGLLADRFGLSALRTATISEIEGQWRLSQQRIFTDDLRFGGMTGTEPISIYARGSIGLDKTLDFTIEPELSEQLMLEAPSTSTLSSTVLKTLGGLERVRRLVGRHHLTGTIEKPQYKFEFSLDQLLNPGVPVGRLNGLLDRIR